MRYYGLERRIDRFRPGPRYEDDGFAAAGGGVIDEGGD